MLQYNIVRIPKSQGLNRTIYIVSKDARRTLRDLLPSLEMILADIDSPNVSYAFQKSRNCAQAALQHVGYKHTLSLDLKDFFSAVTRAHLEPFVPSELLDQCLINGAPQQGLPTSPILANIAFAECDKAILSALKRFNLDACYSRYADDLTFSFDDRRMAGKISTVIFQVVASHGFTINPFKTRLQSLSNGRIIIHGIGVDSHGLHATRKIKKKMRAALHQGNTHSFKGLEEWSKCKLGQL